MGGSFHKGKTSVIPLVALTENHKFIYLYIPPVFNSIIGDDPVGRYSIGILVGYNVTLDTL